MSNKKTMGMQEFKEAVEKITKLKISGKFPNFAQIYFFPSRSGNKIAIFNFWLQQQQSVGQWRLIQKKLIVFKRSLLMT